MAAKTGAGALLLLLVLTAAASGNAAPSAADASFAESVSNFAALTAFSAALPPCSAAPASSDFLIVVGDVGPTFARILFEPLCGPGHAATASSSSPIAVSARLKVRSPTARLFAQLTVPAGRPRVLHLVDLMPATAYNVSFDHHKATFTTLPLPTTAVSATAASAPNPTSTSAPSSDSPHFASESSAALHLSPLKLLFVSCDRWLEDGDSSFFDVLSKNERNRFGIVHMGDQIYADAIARAAASLPRAHLIAAAASGPTAENKVAAAIVADALAAFRDMYRRSWSRPAMRRVLRVGAHFMLPDDHDVINNLDPRMLNSSLSASASASASAELATANALVVAAGRQAYYEYQQQLRDDWTAADDALTHAALRLDPWRAALAISAVDPSTNPTAASSAASGAVDTEHQEGSHGGDGAASTTVASFHLASGAAEIRGSSVYMSARQLLGGDGSTMHSAHFASTSSSLPSSSSSKRAADDAATATTKKTTTPVYFARQMGATGVIFLDLRFQRTFAASKNATLLGADQLAFVRETMKSFDRDASITDIVLVSSIPLVFHHPRLAELADRVEGERYATHPHHLPDLVRLLTTVLLRDSGANGSSNSADSMDSADSAGSAASTSTAASSTGSAGRAESAGAAKTGTGSGTAAPLEAAGVAGGSAPSWTLSSKVRLIVGGDLHMYADANICVSPPRAPGSLAATLASLEALTQGANAAASAASAGANDGSDTSGSGGGGTGIDDNHSAASRLSSLFGRTSFRPQSPPPQCVGQMVTSGMTRGSVTAGSFKLWLFAFLNANIFPSVVEVPGSGAVCSDTPKSLLAWLTSLVWPAESAQSVSEASVPSSQTLQGGAGGGCDSADELVDTEDCVAAPSTQLNVNAATTKDSSAPQSPPQSPPSSAAASSASRLPDFLLDFNLFFFGFNYGVVLLPPSPTFAYADSAFAPLLRSPASLQHPEAPMSTAASTRGANGSGPGSGPAASPLSASLSSSSSPREHQSPSPSATSSASTDAHTSKPYAPVLSSVRTPMRRLGNIVWYAEVGVPLPISWLILQLIFDNFIHLAGALLIGISGYYILSRKAQAMGAPHRAANLAPVPSPLSTGIATEGAATGEVQAR